MEFTDMTNTSWLIGAASAFLHQIETFAGGRMLGFGVLLLIFAATLLVAGLIRRLVNTHTYEDGGRASSLLYSGMYGLTGLSIWVPLGCVVGLLDLVFDFSGGSMTVLDALITGVAVILVVSRMFGQNLALGKGGENEILMGLNVDLPLLMPIWFLSVVLGMSLITAVPYAVFAGIQSMLGGFLWSWVATGGAVVCSLFIVMLILSSAIGFAKGAFQAAGKGSGIGLLFSSLSLKLPLMTYVSTPAWVDYVSDRNIIEAKRKWQDHVERRNAQTERQAGAPTALDLMSLLR